MVTVLSSGTLCQEAGLVPPTGMVSGFDTLHPSHPFYFLCTAGIPPDFSFFPSTSVRMVAPGRSPVHSSSPGSSAQLSFLLLSWHRPGRGKIPLVSRLHLPATSQTQSLRERVPDSTEHKAFALNVCRLVHLKDKGQDLHMLLKKSKQKALELELRPKGRKGDKTGSTLVLR